MSKSNLISELYNETVQKVSSSPQEWKKFLSVACRNYKLRYDEQLLLYAQRPDAVAVLTYAEWISRFNRHVNKGSKGIAVFDKDLNGDLIKYYFDIQDTVETERSIPVPIWQMQESYNNDVLLNLERAFGHIDNKDNFTLALVNCVNHVVAQNIPSYIGDMLTAKSADSPDMNTDTFMEAYKEIVAESVSYSILSRLNISAESMLSENSFQYLEMFNTHDTFDNLAICISDMSKKILSVIAHTVFMSRKKYKNTNRTFADTKGRVYNEYEKQNSSERNDDNNDRNHLQNRQGRLSVSEPQNARSDNGQIGTLRTDETEVFTRESSGNVLQHDDSRNVGGTPDRSGADGDRDAGTLDEGVGGEGKRDRGSQIDRPNEMDSDDEQHKKSGRGNHSSRFDLQLSNHDFDAVWNGTEYFYQNKEKNELIKSFLAPHTEEIAMFYESHSDSKERSDFIMSFFNSESYETTLKSGITAGFEAYSDAIRLWKGDSGETPEREAWEKWHQIESSVFGMILLEEWIEPIKSLLPSVEEQIEFIGTKLKDDILPLPQAAVDYILSYSSDVREGKMQTYRQFTESLSKEENIKFIKQGYGLGGHSDAIPGSGYWESHSSKGIEISDTYSIPERRVLLTWDYVAKRISELIRLDRYLNPKEKEYYPVWLENQNQTELAKVPVSDNPIRQPYRGYLEVKEDNSDSLVFYQVGDFFEAFNDDAKTVSEALDLMITTRPITDKDSVPMVGLPKHALETYITMLTDRGYDVAVASLENGERKVYNLVSQNKEDPVESKPIGRIEYLHTDGSVRESIEYTSSYQFEKDIKEENHYGVPMAIVFYKDKDGKSIPNNFLSSLNPPLQGIKYIDSPYLKLDNAIQNAVIATLPTIKCEWSESPVFKDGEVYSVAEFDRLMKQADDERVKGKAAAIEKYGSSENWYNSDIEDEYTQYYGYDKVKFTLNMPDGTAFTERQDIGDGNGGVIDFLKQYSQYDQIIPILEQAVNLSSEKNSSNENVSQTPDVIEAEKHNFKITDDNLGIGGLKEKFRNNMAAITLLHGLELQNRLATPEEQEILSKYVGFGGLSDAFDDTKQAWENECLELKSILTVGEYAAARESTLTAFYTPPIVIRAMYEALSNMGFSRGNILEPSCGTGNFIGMLPDKMQGSKFYGVELDSLTGRIAQQLYQKSTITVQGYESAALPDSFFDVAIGNVPFGQFKVLDKKYDKHNWLIHDYFFGKTLDKVRPGGVIAFITSSGTMDKKNPAVRKYIAQRAELLGAIRLPNNTFKANASTEVTSDIIFLQKRNTIVNDEPDWIHLDRDQNGNEMNKYFVDHPEMILGEMIMESSQFGHSLTCKPYEDRNLSELLSEAIQNIHAEITEFDIAEMSEAEDNSVPADPDVKNFSFTVVEDKIYYRQDSRMNPVDVSSTAEGRIKGMINIRDCVRELIRLQTDDYPESSIKLAQNRLNSLYDDFTKKYGLLNSKANKSVFADDSSYCLLCSLEILDENGKLKRKADMFTKRTIKPHIKVNSVSTASEALAVSIGEKAKIDMPFMCELTGKNEQEIFTELKGVIFLNPMHGYGNSSEAKYLMADEYLSGNVRKKLDLARKTAKLYPDDYNINVEMLEKVQPKDLSASEISVRLGATWLPPEDIQDFIFELLQTPRYAQLEIKVHYSNLTAEWNIENKSYDSTNVMANSTYGTKRINAYKIIEETLNLKDVRIFDYYEDAYGNKKAVLNKEETAIAQGKQEMIKAAFQDWIWKDPKRRERLVRKYNDLFNSMRPREYDGSHITFSGMSPEISLRPHQINAVARILYGGNTLLAHVVGAGKTFEIVAAAQESKRLGLCNKSLIVVPNHLTEQWASEYLQLYPSANILVATKKDFETNNRKKFCARIATGDYDAIIIGHSQFEKIPISVERQKQILQQQIDEIATGIAKIKFDKGESFTVKQFEKTKKNLQTKLDKLNNQGRKDDVVTFEELGVDRLFVDEAHNFKNLFLYTKMRNVGGIAQTEAQKSSDLYMKCRYLDEITGNKGVIFATGTPVSNSMVELYTMQRYLQYDALTEKNLQHFDAWASTFGETVTAIELAPEGTGYRSKTRFAKFYNLPELMMMFRDIADIQTADMLNLPVPKANFHTVAVKPTEIQKELVATLSERAEKVRNKQVDSSTDNMLLITNDGRKLALDQRLTNEMLPDDPNSKVSICVNNVYEIWERTAPQKSTQLIFCDLSTPHNDGKFNVYDDIRNKLIAKGVPENEIAFIHNADSEAKKKELFSKVRSGQIRILLGSTAKMGAGTNVQQKLIAIHHTDCPWRPADLQQREGRIIRQGNENPEVEIYSYVTEQTFDAYLYQLVENKQKFIGQIMTSKSPVRSAEDVDEQALSYAEIKALATGNPLIKEKMDLDVAVSKLKLLKQNHLSQRYTLEDKIIGFYPNEIRRYEERIQGYKTDIQRAKDNTVINADGFSPMVIEGVNYSEKKGAGSALLSACKAASSEPKRIGTYRGFDMELSYNAFTNELLLALVGSVRHSTPLGTDIYGNITRIDNILSSLPDQLTAYKELLANSKIQLENAKAEIKRPFPQEDELSEKMVRLAELNALLDRDNNDTKPIEGEPDTANKVSAPKKNKTGKEYPSL